MDSELIEKISEAEESKKSDSIHRIILISEPKYGEEGKYTVATHQELKSYPSRMTVYDTYFKETNQDRRRDSVYRIISKMGFGPSVNNLGHNFEQNFLKDIHTPTNFVSGNHTLMNLRLKPNLLTVIDFIDDETSSIVGIFRGFFIPEQVIESLKVKIDLEHIIREIKIEKIMESII
jgi:hypothetical protein